MRQSLSCKNNAAYIIPEHKDKKSYVRFNIFVAAIDEHLVALSPIIQYSFMSHIARFILRLLGWNIYSRVPTDIPRAVIIMAPHTSNWDFIIGRLAFYWYRMPPRILIKKEAFTGIIGPVLRLLGGIPVDRAQSQNTVKEITRRFHAHDTFYLLITPEGTRRLVKKWKRGFYFIALNAGVPIFLAFLDYRKKEGGIGMMLEPSGDFEADFKIIEDFYRGKQARHPEKFNLSK